MSIGRRLILSYVFIVGFIVSLVALSFLSFTYLVDRLEREHEVEHLHTVTLIPSLQNLRYWGSEMTASFPQVLLYTDMLNRLVAESGDQEHIADMREELEAEEADFRGDLSAYKASLEHYSAAVAEYFPEELDAVVGLRENGDALIETGMQMLRINAERGSAVEISEATKEFEIAERIFFSAIDSILALEESIARKQKQKNEATMAAAKIGGFLGILFSGTLILIYGVWITRSITEPLGKLTDAAVRTGQGKYGIKAKVSGNDEIGILAHAFEEMSQDLSINISALKETKGDLNDLNFELAKQVVDLESEIVDRTHAEAALQESEKVLQAQAEELRISRDEARTADRTKSEFLASMSHELRTPLSAINGFSELISTEAFGPIGNVKYRDYANDINESGRHLLSLINEILDLSKIEAGKSDLHEETIEIPAVATVAMKLVGQRAELAGLTLELDFPSHLPALFADERKLKQIFVNLLANAVKFTDSGGVVTLRARCNTDSGHVFQIVDTGIGMVPEDVAKALSKFGQVDGDLDRQHEGTGLGLPLAKALVELHGGALEIQSEKGVGTTVTLYFPVERIVVPRGGLDALGDGVGLASRGR